MYIKIRPLNFAENEPALIIHVRKNTYIYEILKQVVEKWPCPGFHQKLYHRGKQLSPHFRIINYDIHVNDVIQVVLTKININRNLCRYMVDVDSKFYKAGDLVEVRCESYYCWWSAVIVGVKKHNNSFFSSKMTPEEIEHRFTFFVRLDKQHKNNQIFLTQFDAIRPRANSLYKFNEIEEGEKILVQCCWWNCRGFWYDFLVDHLDSNTKVITGSIILNPELPHVRNCQIPFKRTTKIYKIRTHELMSSPTHLGSFSQCLSCVNKLDDRCINCGCYICAGDKPELMELQKTKPTVYLGNNEIWGRGMACVGRSKECSVVPLTHFGPVPGVDVGARWKFRIQVSEAGVHRPPVAGIHGRDNHGAYSIVMAGGYADDVDNGNEIIYSGSGGRDFSGNKRTAEQTKDQELTRNNKALALNCNAEFNDEIGAESDDWKNGKPVRVCRSAKFARFSEFAPRAGIRYDGIYKVVRYYKQLGKSGYDVWKYLLRRDDPTPAPWEEDGQEYDIKYPEGYLEALEVKLPKKQEKSCKRKLKKRKVKKCTSKPVAPKPALASNEKGKGKSTKKAFKLDPEIEKLIKRDALNHKLWEECASVVKLGKLKYMLKVQEAFKCIVCQETVFNPVTTRCKHNTCIECFKRSFEVGIFECSYCRNDLGESYNFRVNKTLAKILETLLPGYGQYR